MNTDTVVTHLHLPFNPCSPGCDTPLGEPYMVPRAAVVTIKNGETENRVGMCESCLRQMNKAGTKGAAKFLLKVGRRLAKHPQRYAVKDEAA